MTETTKTQEQEELTEIKIRLDQMGVKYHHNAKLATLKTLLANELEPKSKPEESKSEFQDVMESATALVRCRITCMNPAKRDWQGEIFTAGNSVIGVVKKFVPFNSEAAESYHIPKILLDAMRDRKFLQTRKIKAPNGQESQETFLVPEFTIAELPPLTKEELEKLARDQRAARGQV